MLEDQDYAVSGLTVQQAMLAAVKAAPPRNRAPVSIKWGQHRIQTSCSIVVPPKGTVRLAFLSANDKYHQGVDIKVSGGILLANGSTVPLLRTWKDDLYEDVVEYNYESPDMKLWLWNVYDVQFPSGNVATEKWTGNAGLWVEDLGKNQWVCHCSAGPCSPPNFEVLVFSISIR